MENTNNQEAQTNSNPQAAAPVQQPTQEQPASSASMNSASQSPLNSIQIDANQPFDNAHRSTDVLGIVSLVAIALHFIIPFIPALVGTIVGFIGIRKAKREGYSPVLSQVGFWVSLTLLVINIILLIIIFSWAAGI